MSTYPTPDELRRHAEHAFSMADEYRREENHKMADRREEDGTWYLILAEREELAISRKLQEQQREAA